MVKGRFCVKSGVKRFFCVLAATVFVGATLAGCALFERDNDAYYGAIVVRVGNDIVINKRQLIDAYASFGNQFAQNSTKAEAIDKTLEALITREVAARLSAETFGYGEAKAGQGGQFKIRQADGSFKVPVTEEEAEAARKTSFDYILNSLSSVGEEIRKTKKWDTSSIVTADANQKAATTGVVYKPYEKFITKPAGTTTYVLELEKYRDLPKPEAAYKTNAEFLAFVKSNRKPDSAIEQNIANESYNRLLRYLGNRYKGMGVSGDNLILEELKRVQLDEEKNAMVRRLSNCYELGLVLPPDFTFAQKIAEYERLMNLRGSALYFNQFVAEVRAANQGYVNGLAQDASEFYKKKIATAAYDHEHKYDDITAYAQKILDGIKEVSYVPDEIADEFFSVSHILIGYTDEQKTELAQINARLKQGGNPDDYTADITKLHNRVKIVGQNAAGEKEGEEFNASQVLAEVKRVVDPFNPNKTLKQKQKDFQSQIYRFNSDPGMQNAEFEYVIGVDKRTNQEDDSTEEDKMSKMVKEFTKESRALYIHDRKAVNKTPGFMPAEKYKEKYNLVDSDFKTDEARAQLSFGLIDMRGTISNLVWTEHGAHIIMYTRKIREFVYTGTEAYAKNGGYRDFLDRTLTSYGTKTNFDLALEGFSKNQYEVYEREIVKAFKRRTDSKGQLVNPITYYKSNYKDLTKE